jgi:Membrane domain of glycerophosphoryl diester phosphodiesterase
METLRPLTLGELLDRTFQIYRNNFLLFAGIAAVAYLPMFIIRSGLVWAPRLGGGSASIALGIGLLIFCVLYLVGVAAAQSGTIIAVSAVHLSQPITIGEAYSRVREMLGRIVLLTIGIGIGVGIGFLFLIVPGIVLFLMWALAVPVAVLEDASLGEATSRSRQLTAGHRGRVFVIYALFFILSVLVQVALASPLGVVAVLNRNAGHGSSATIQVVTVAISYVTQILVTPLVSIAFSLMYYDERVRKEGFDIELMMKGLEGDQGQSAAATAS